MSPQDAADEGWDMYQAEEDRDLAEMHAEAYALRIERERQADLRSRALALVEAHPAQHKAAFEDRLLAMSTDELAAYLALRADVDRMVERDRAKTYAEREEWSDVMAPCSPVRSRDKREPGEIGDGQDPSLVLGEVDHPRVEIAEMPRLAG